MRSLGVIPEPRPAQPASRKLWLLVLLIFIISMVLLWVSFFAIDSRGWGFALRCVAILGACFSPLIITFARRKGR